MKIAFVRSLSALVAGVLISPAFAQQDSVTAPADPLQTLAEEEAAKPPEARKGLVHTGGPTVGEATVARALKWIVEHQDADGGWRFDHRGGKCDGRCANEGTLKDCRTAATAFGMLPLLGAGQTPREGKYKKQVQAGLDFLKKQMKVTDDRGDLSQPGGSMYSHGLATLTLCELYGMTADKELKETAQQALNHIVYAQDPVGGGWRYTPRMPGDTSVFGWQLSSLKSGRSAGLEVPKATMALAGKFLDSVQSEEGGTFGYTTPGAGPATTAAGLLGRIHLGAKLDDPAIAKGVQFLIKTGPSPGNLYYDLYATQVMSRVGGEARGNWNFELRGMLEKSQDAEGHQAGSWFVSNGDHGAQAGGRLYCTAMATLIQEVYYRQFPLFNRDEMP